MGLQLLDARRLFEAPVNERFPACTQVTLCHGICDSRCISCPVGRLNYGDASRETLEVFPKDSRRFMPFEIFARVADEVGAHEHAWLRLHARGEPLLHPQFVEFIAFAKKAGVRVVQAFTDAIRLDADMSSSILAAGLDVLECSVHGHANTYETLMRNGQYERVVDNIIRFRRLRDRAGGPTRLVVSAVDQPGFQTDKPAHHEFWRAYADEVIYRPHHSWGGRIDGVCSALPEKRGPCSQLWTRCTVGPTGKVLACFNSWSEEGAEVLGDISSGDTIAAMWTSQAFSRIRQDHANGCYTLPCCAHCSDYVGSAWGANSYDHLLRARLGLGGGDAC